jgi:CheY-like chemotaxis protein
MAGNTDLGLGVLLRELSILVVEDNAPTREATQLLLESLGANVVAVEDGHSALDHLSHVRPDLVLTDLGMPRIGGRGLLDRLRADPLHRSIPVVAVSAAFETGGPTRFDGHLQKPYGLRDLAAVLREAIRRNKPAFARQCLRLRTVSTEERRRGGRLRERCARVLNRAAQVRASGQAFIAGAG